MREDASQENDQIEDDETDHSHHIQFLLGFLIVDVFYVIHDCVCLLETCSVSLVMVNGFRAR